MCVAHSCHVCCPACRSLATHPASRPKHPMPVATLQCLRDLLGEPGDHDPNIIAARRLGLLPARPRLLSVPRRARSRARVPCSLVACLRAAACCRCSWHPSQRQDGRVGLLGTLSMTACDRPNERCQGWQHHGSRACSTSFPEVAWLGAVPSEAGTTIAPDHMLIALCRRLRWPLP